MPIFQVSYDLNQPGQNYARLEKAIKASYSWNHVLKSTWLVWTGESYLTLQARLNQAIDKTDRLFLSRVTSENGGFMNTPVWEWIKSRLQSEEKAAG